MPPFHETGAIFYIPVIYASPPPESDTTAFKPIYKLQIVYTDRYVQCVVITFCSRLNKYAASSELAIASYYHCSLRAEWTLTASIEPVTMANLSILWFWCTYLDILYTTILQFLHTETLLDIPHRQ